MESARIVGSLTLRRLDALTTDEIARAFLLPEPTIAQRIVRAKRTLADARAEFERTTALTRNERERALLLKRAAECGGGERAPLRRACGGNDAPVGCRLSLTAAEERRT